MLLAALALLTGSVAAPPVARSEQMLVEWQVGEARCAGGPVATVRAPEPQPDVEWRAVQQRDEPVVVSFRIDADGRPLSIVATGDLYGARSDLVPALAVARFAPGVRSGCVLRMMPHATRFAAASTEQLLPLTIHPAIPVPAAVWARLNETMPGCAAPRPGLLLQAFPDFRRLPAEPGRSHWTVVGFDVGGDGRPRHVSAIDGNGDAPLDRAAVSAVARSRFATGMARTGCHFPYWRDAAIVPPPPSIDRAQFRGVDSACPADDAAWATMPPLVFPPAFQRRMIEGWALIGYDVASWGQTGNVRVLAAEPAAEFGTAAAGIVRQATRPASARGASGCVERVLFKLPLDTKAPATD